MLSSAAISALKQIVGAENVLTDAYSLDCYSGDALNPYRAYGAEDAFERLADAVVRPGNTNQVSEIVSWAMTEKAPPDSHGRGHGSHGRHRAGARGVVVDLKRMDRILEVNAKDLTAMVEGGVVLHDLVEKLAEHGLMPATTHTACRSPLLPGPYPPTEWATGRRPSGPWATRSWRWKWSCPTGG